MNEWMNEYMNYSQMMESNAIFFGTSEWNAFPIVYNFESFFLIENQWKRETIILVFFLSSDPCKQNEQLQIIIEDKWRSCLLVFNYLLVSR